MLLCFTSPVQFTSVTLVACWLLIASSTGRSKHTHKCSRRQPCSVLPRRVAMACPRPRRCASCCCRGRVGSPPCSVPGWKRLEVVQTLDWSVINTTNLPLQHSFFGVEGGHMISVNNTLYTVITEFTRPPLWVPSNIALWKANLPPARNANTGGGHQSQRSRVNTGADAAQWPHAWRRVRTLFESEGTTGGTDCKSLRASLGSSASLAFDDTHTAGTFSTSGSNRATTRCLSTARAESSGRCPALQGQGGRASRARTRTIQAGPCSAGRRQVAAVVGRDAGR